MIRSFRLKLNFIDVNAFNSEEYGVFMISGDILHRIDLIINNIFNEKGKLNKEELELLEVDKVMKNDFCFYISMIKIIFFDSKGSMSFKFNEIKSNYSNEDNFNLQIEEYVDISFMVERKDINKAK